MKKFGAFNQDGFKGSIELLRFLRELSNDMTEILASLVGVEVCFVKGGDITEALGQTTITDGILLKDGDFYLFQGGTYVGTPSTLLVAFETKTNPSFPKPYFVGDPIPKDIYLQNYAKVDVSGAIALDAIKRIDDLRTLTDKVKSNTDDIADISSILPTKADVGGYDDIVGFTINTPKIGAFTTPIVRKYDSGLVHVCVPLVTGVGQSITSADWLIRGLPVLSPNFITKVTPAYYADALSGWTPGLLKHLLIEQQDGDPSKTQIKLLTGTMTEEEVIHVDVMYFTT